MTVQSPAKNNEELHINSAIPTLQAVAAMQALGLETLKNSLVIGGGTSDSLEASYRAARCTVAGVLNRASEPIRGSLRYIKRCAEG